MTTTTETREAGVTGTEPAMTSVQMVLASSKASESFKYKELDLTKIEIIPEFNIDPSRMKDSRSIAQLAKTIQATGGLIQDVLIGEVKESGETHHYLIAGHRRYAAYELLGWKTIPSKIRTFDSYGAMIANAAENVGREAVRPVHQAKRMALIKETYFKGDKEADSKIAEAFGCTKKHVQNLLRMHKNLSPKLRKVLESDDCRLDEASPSFKWLVEHCTESHEEQDAAFEVRFGQGADEDEDKPKKKTKKSDGDDEDKPKKTRVRNRDEILWAREKILRKLTDAQLKGGYGVTLSVRGFTEPKEKKLTERDRLLLREAFSWVLDASRGDFLIAIEPEEEEEESDEE